MRLFAAAVFALLLGTSVHAQSTVRPVAGTEVGLEREPERTVAPRPTDRLGNVVFTDLLVSSYTVFIPDASRLRAPVSIRISADDPTLGSQTYTIQPGRGRAYALDARGQRLVVTILRARGRIGVNVSSIFDRGQEGPMSSY